MSLPLNCHVTYHQGFLSKEESRDLYRELVEEYDIASCKLEIVPGTKSDFSKLMFIDRELVERGSFLPAEHCNSG